MRTEQAGHRRPQALLLVSLIALALVYGTWLYLEHSITGHTRIDGGLGVLLGLFTCSRGAANLLDLLLYGGRRRTPWGAEMLWIALNVLVLVAGSLVIVAGATQFTRVAPS